MMTGRLSVSRLVALMLAAPYGVAGLTAQDQDGPRILSPGRYDFSTTPFDALEYEVRWISRPDAPEADTSFVYMTFQPFLSEQRAAIRATWLPFSGNLANMDLILLDPATYAVRYRLEPRAAGGFGIFWYEEGRSYAAQIDSTGHNAPAEMNLERPVFSVPTLAWVLAQLSGRIDEPVRIEVPGYSPENGGRVTHPVLTPGERYDLRPPEGGGSYPIREMTLDFESGRRWRYYVTDVPPYFLGITAWNAEGVETSRIRVVHWAEPALDPVRRLPLIMRQSYIDGN